MVLAAHFSPCDNISNLLLQNVYLYAFLNEYPLFTLSFFSRVKIQESIN